MGKIRNYLNSNYSVFLCLLILCAVVYGLPVLSQNEDYIIAMQQMDAGLIIHGIQGLFGEPIYNQNNSFGTRFYNWPFQAISFFIILFLKGIGSVFGFYAASIFTPVYDNLILNSAIRIQAFVFYVISVYAFYIFAKLVTKKPCLSFALAIFFSVIPYAGKFSYFVHPDSTGLMFFLLGFYCLIKNIERLGKITLFVVVTCFSLAIMSKQVYLFNVLFAIIVTVIYLNKTGLNNISLAQTLKQNLLVIIFTPLLCMLFFNPYALLEMEIFLAGQDYLRSAHSSSISLSYQQALLKWFNVVVDDSIISINFLCLPFVFYAMGKKLNIWYLKYWCASVLYVIFFLVVLLPLNAKLFFIPHYFYPIIPFALLNIVAFFGTVIFIVKGFGGGKLISCVLFALFWAFYGFELYNNAIVSLNEGLRVAIYKNTTYMAARSYIINSIDFRNSHFMVDPSIIYPVASGAVCNTWTCATYESIRSFTPDYVVLEKDYAWSDHGTVGKYMRDNGFNELFTVAPNYNFSYAVGSYLHTLELIDILTKGQKRIGPEISLFNK